MIQDTGGVPVVYGGISTWGHRDVATEVALQDGAEVVVTQDVVRVATGILAALAELQPITVDGEQLKVGEHRRIDDGSLTLIELQTLPEDWYG